MLHYVINLIYNECYISFRFDFAPNVLFGGIYIQPENSKYFKLQTFADVDNLLARCNSCNYISFIGGGFNTRMGDLNNLALSWKYETNRDNLLALQTNTAEYI